MLAMPRLKLLTSRLLHQRSQVHLARSVTKLSVKEAFSNPHRDEVSIAGWIRHARHQKKVSFLHITDGMCHQRLQIVIPGNLLTKELTSTLTYGASIKAIGKIVDSPNPKQPVELVASEIKLIGPCDPNTYVFNPNNKGQDGEFQRQHLHMRSKRHEFAALLRLRAICKQAIHDYFQKNDYLQIDTPILTSNDCEGGGEVFQVNSAAKSSYFGDGKAAYLTVSGQLHLEACNAGLARVYTFGPTFRADNAVDRTHLAEFYMVEVELAFIDKLSELLDLMEDFTKKVGSKILNETSIDIDVLHTDSKDTYEAPWHCLEQPFSRITYTDAVTLLDKSTKKFSRKPKWGDDLQREHEHIILQEHNNRPTFVTDWPKSLKPFYAHCNGDGTVACVDLLVPGPGELFGGSMRESRYDTLKETLDSIGMTEDYQWYLDLRRYGSVPHGGFGMGFERFLQFLLGVKQIRDAIPFPRYANNCKL